MPSRRLVATLVAVVLVAPFVLSGAALAAPPTRSTWDLSRLPAAARENVRAAIADVVPSARPVLRRVRGLVSIDDRTSRCRRGEWSCSYAGSGEDGGWGIHLDARTTSASQPSNRFLVLHEIGHAVWGLVLDDAGRRAFVGAVHAALGGRPCVRGDGAACAGTQEVFADEFARFAGGFAVSMSWYDTPPLLDSDTFASLLPPDTEGTSS
jgi:hypothetical protein